MAWVYKTIVGADGKPTKLKAKFVARGFQQTKGIDLDEVFVLMYHQVEGRQDGYSFVSK